MRILARGVLLVLAVAGGVLLVAAAVTVWTAATWDVGRADTLRLSVALEGTTAARALAAGIAGSAAAMLLITGVIVAFVHPRTVTLWLRGQHAVRVPAGTVEQYIRAAVDGVRGVEQARVTLKPAGRRTTALTVDLTVAPDADAPAVTAAAEERIGSALMSSCGIVLDRRPSITIRYAAGVRDRSPHRAA